MCDERVVWVAGFDGLLGSGYSRSPVFVWEVKRTSWPESTHRVTQTQWPHFHLSERMPILSDSSVVF